MRGRTCWKGDASLWRSADLGGAQADGAVADSSKE